MPLINLWGGDYFESLTPSVSAAAEKPKAYSSQTHPSYGHRLYEKGGEYKFLKTKKALLAECL
jgi:hypothetical protein